MITDYIFNIIFTVLLGGLGFLFKYYFNKINKHIEMIQDDINKFNVIVSEFRLRLSTHEKDIVKVEKDCSHNKELIDKVDEKLDKTVLKTINDINKVRDRVLILETEHKRNHPKS